MHQTHTPQSEQNILLSIVLNKGSELRVSIYSSTQLFANHIQVPRDQFGKIRAHLTIDNHTLKPMRRREGKGLRAYLECFDEGEGNPASQLNGGTQCSKDACSLPKSLRHKGQPIAYFAILLVLLAVEVMIDGP